MLDLSIKKQEDGFTLDISFQAKSDRYALIGASGSGKTMTLRAIAGLVKPDQGQIIIDDRVLFDSKQKINLPVRQRRVGLLAQSYALFPHLTVEENIGFGLKKIDKKLKKELVNDQLKSIRLGEYGGRYPNQLSGGQQQRVALARALVTRPDILLLDEPLSALDSYLREQMEEEILEALANYQGATILVTHNIEEAYRLANHIMVMDQGRLVDFGDKERVISQPANPEAARLVSVRKRAPIFQGKIL